MDEKRMPKEVEEALTRLEHALLNAGCMDEPFVLDLDGGDFRRLFWPKHYSASWVATYRTDAMGEGPRLPEEAWTTESIRFGHFEVRKRRP